MGNTPVLTCIHEETEPASQKSSFKRSVPIATIIENQTSCDNVTEFTATPMTTVLLTQAVTALTAATGIINTSPQCTISSEKLLNHTTNAENNLLTTELQLQKLTPLPLEEAVAYLRRKSIAMEELRTLHETSTKNDI